MSRSTRMHGSIGTRKWRGPDGRERTYTGWLYRPGWRGHAPLELARRRRRSKAAKLARRRNRGRS